MYTATDRQEAIFLAREALGLLETDPMGCMEHSGIIEDTLLDYQMSWNVLGVTEDEYHSLLKTAAIICAREHFDRIKTSENHQKAVWIKSFEKVVRCFKLEWHEIRIRKTDFLMQKCWHARLDDRPPASARTGTNG